MVDVVTVPNLSEHLSSAETTEHLSAPFAYAAAMKSINNLLLRSAMARAASGTMPDMIAARQEIDLRPQLERLDCPICWSEDIDERALTFAFRPLWQLDEPAKAALALQKAQATQVYAGLKLWPDAVMAKLAETQLVADGTYPNAAALFAEVTGEPVADAREIGVVSRAGGSSWPGEEEPRDWHGRWMRGKDPDTSPSGALSIQIAGIADDLEGAGGGKPRVVPTPKGAKQFIFPNGMILRFDLEPV